LKIIDLNEKKNSKKYNIASFFAGAGGLDMGLERVGFKTVWVNDIDKDACATHKYNVIV
jgi:DNA (cytosine-5)-methyltransferase 1